MTVKFFQITRASMRQVKNGEKLSEHGVVFERLTNGDGRFSVNVMADGQRIHRVIGKESEGITRKQAEELIAKLRTDARHGRLHLPKGRKIILSFKEVAEKYLEKQKIEGAKNLKQKNYQLNLHLIPFFNETSLNKISGFDIERYKKFRTDKNIKPNSINRELATLSHLFTKAMEWQWLDKKPATIKRFKENHSRITYLTIEQIERLLEAAKQDQNIQVYPFIMIGLETAMRKMEILSIKLSDIDLEPQNYQYSSSQSRSASTTHDCASHNIFKSHD